MLVLVGAHCARARRSAHGVHAMSGMMTAAWEMVQGSAVSGEEEQLSGGQEAMEVETRVGEEDVATEKRSRGGGHGGGPGRGWQWCWQQWCW